MASYRLVLPARSTPLQAGFAGFSFRLFFGSFWSVAGNFSIVSS